VCKEDTFPLLDCNPLFFIILVSIIQTGDDQDTLITEGSQDNSNQIIEASQILVVDQEALLAALVKSADGTAEILDANGNKITVKYIHIISYYHLQELSCPRKCDFQIYPVSASIGDG
jgi:hypothetical protein